MAKSAESLDPALSNMITNHKKLDKSGTQYVTTLKSLTAQTIKATLATAAFNALVGAGVGIAISAIIKLGEHLYDIFTISEEEMQDCAAAAEELNTSVSQNDSFIQSIETLTGKLKDENLTLEEQNTVKEQLLTIQESLIEKYGEEAAAIDLVNGGYEDMIALIKLKSKEDYAAWKAKASATNDAGDSIIDEAVDRYSSFDYDFGIQKAGTNVNGEIVVSPTQLGKQYFAFIEKASSDVRRQLSEVFAYDGYKLQFKPEIDAEEARAALANFSAAVGELNRDGEFQILYNHIADGITAAEDAISSSKQTFITDAEGIVKYTDSISIHYDQVQNSVSEFNDALSTKEVDRISAAYEKLSSDVYTFTESVANSSDKHASAYALYYEKIYNSILSQAKKEAVTIELQADESALKTQVQTIVEDLKMQGLDLSAEVKGAIWSKSISQNSREYKVLNKLAGDLDTTMAGVIDKLEEYGYFGKASLPEVNDEIDKAVQSYQNIIATLTTVREEQDVTGQISTATMMKLTALGEDYADLIKTETNALGELVYVFDTDAAEKFALDQLQIATNAVIAADGTEEQIDALNSYYRSMQPLTSQMEGYIATVKELDEIQKEVAKGTQYTEEEINELLKKYPQLTAVVDESTGKYKITETSIESLKGKFTSLIQTIIDVKTEMAKLMAVFAAKEARDGWAGAEQWVKLIQKKIKETGAKTIEELEKELGVTFADDLRGTVQVLVDTTPAVDSYEDVISGEKDAADFIYNPTTDKSDPWKEAFEKEYQAKKHALAMEQIDQKAYLDWLDGAYKKYFSDMSKYQDEYYQYEEEVFNGRRALIDEHISDLEKEYEFLGDESKVIEELNRLLEEKKGLLSDDQRDSINSMILEYQENGIRKQIDAIEDQVELLEDREGTEDQIIECYKREINLLYDLKSVYSQIYDAGSDRMLQLDREIAGLMASINDVKREQWEAQRDAQVDALEEEQDAIEKYQDAIEDILDATVDYIKRQKEEEIEALEDARDARDEWYDNEIDRIEEVADRRKEALEDELEGYRKIIEAKKEALRDEADAEDYNDEVAKRNKEISDLQTRIDKLSLDDSKSAAAERMKLEEELATKKKELAKYQRDYSLDQQIEALDKELENFEDSTKEKEDLIDEQTKAEKERLEAQREMMQKFYDDEIERLRAYLEKEGVLRQQANELIRTQGESLWKELRAYAAEYTTEVENLEEAWNKAAAAASKMPGGELDLLGTNSALKDRYNQNESTIKDLENQTYDDVQNTPAASAEKALIAQYKSLMQMSSEAWKDANAAGNEEEKNYWADRNQKLAQELNEKLGREALTYNKWKGIWYLDGIQFYHKGGVVGGGSLQQNELLSVLKKREMVVTEPMQETMAKYINFAKTASFALTSLLANDPVKNIVAGLKKNGGYTGGSVETIHIDKLFDFHADNVTKEALPGLKSTLKEAADYTIRQMEDRLSRRGIKTKTNTAL